MCSVLSRNKIEHTNSYGQNRGVGNKNKDTPQRAADQCCRLSLVQAIRARALSIKTENLSKRNYERCPLKIEMKEFIIDSTVH